MTDVDDTDSDGTSPDTIFRELCMLRSTTSCKDTSSQYEPVNFNSNSSSESTLFYNSKNKSNSEKLWSSYWSGILNYQNRSTEHLLFLEELRQNEFNRAIDAKENGYNCLSYDNYPPYIRSPFNTPISDNYRSRNLLSETCSRITPLVYTATPTFCSRHTNTPHFDFINFQREKTPSIDRSPREKRSQSSCESNSEDTSNFEYLVRDRCSSSDCACDKQFQSKIFYYKPRHEPMKRRSRPNSEGSQVSETSVCLKLANSDEPIVIQEKDLNKIMKSSKSKKKHDIEPMKSVASDVSTSTGSSSDSAITFLKKCSDRKILSSLGLNRDSDLAREQSPRDIRDSKGSKGHMVETYGKFVNKIEKLKKITSSWKLKKRKHKLSYTLEGIDYQRGNLKQAQCKINLSSGDNADDLSKDTVESLNDQECVMNRIASSKGDHILENQSKITCEIGTQSDQSEVDYMTTAQRKFKLYGNSDASDRSDDILENQTSMTCDIGIQSVQPEHFMTMVCSSIDSADLLRLQAQRKFKLNGNSTASDRTDDNLENQTSMTCDIGIQSVQPEHFITMKKMGQQGSVDSKTSTTQLETNMKDIKKKMKVRQFSDREDKIKSKKRSDSFHAIKNCNFECGEPHWGETQGEILEHLREINRLIERESCASISTHRLCQSERSLGYLGIDNSEQYIGRKLSKAEKEKHEFSKDNKKGGRVYWAVTKVTVYPDSSRTYEVMRHSKRRPQTVPSTSDTVFVLLPKK